MNFRSTESRPVDDREWEYSDEDIPSQPPKGQHSEVLAGNNHAGSSGAARKVMDFFSRAKKERLERLGKLKRVSQDSSLRTSPGHPRER
jgi:hypothetical protein